MTTGSAVLSAGTIESPPKPDACDPADRGPICYFEMAGEGLPGAGLYIEECGASPHPPWAVGAPAFVAQGNEVFYCGRHRTAVADGEDGLPRSMGFQDGEQAVAEKIPGTFTGLSLLPVTDGHPEAYGEHRNILVFSRDTGAAGFAFKNNLANLENLQVRATTKLRETITAKGLMVVGRPLILLGGAVPRESGGGDGPEFKLFAALLGYGADQRCLGFSDIKALADYLGVPTAPELYCGP